jgi:hypothetical protein
VCITVLWIGPPLPRKPHTCNNIVQIRSLDLFHSYNLVFYGDNVCHIPVGYMTSIDLHCVHALNDAFFSCVREKIINACNIVLIISM